MDRVDRLWWLAMTLLIRALILLVLLPGVARAEPTVVFVHGLYVTHRCWDGWREVFEEAGYETLAPEWPGHDGEPAALRAAPPAALEDLDLAGVLALHREVIAGLDEPPILVGHSMGGLVVQLLLAEGHGRAGVAIDSAPPRGLQSLKWSFVKSNLPVLSGKGPILLSERQFRYAFVHTSSREEAARLYEAHVVPEARGVAKGPLTDVARVDWTAERPPLLLIAGGEDHIIPPGLVRRNAKRWSQSPSRTDLREFPGRTHWILAQEGWREVADHVLAWLADPALAGSGG